VRRWTPLWIARSALECGGWTPLWIPERFVDLRRLQNIKTLRVDPKRSLACVLQSARALSKDAFRVDPKRGCANFFRKNLNTRRLIR